jgi:N-acyl homoserine lactone hydrolase
MRVADIRPVHVLDVVVEGRPWPGFVHALDHPDGLVLVDTGMIDSRPELDEEWSPTIYPERIPREVACIINTHLHFDHCGGNRLFPGVPIHVQRIEREAARRPDYTIREWVEFDGASYVELDGEAEIVPGVSVVPTPGHAPGHQSVVVATDEGVVVVAGDVAYTWRTFHDPENEAAAVIRALQPRRVWLAHETEAWEPSLD